MVLQAIFITRIIWNSWSHASIVPVIKSGKCIGCRFESDRILRDLSVHHEHPIQESARGRPVNKPQFGVLNKF
jgi:hypothetical protein